VNLAEASRRCSIAALTTSTRRARLTLMLNTAKDNFEDIWRVAVAAQDLKTGATPLTIADLKLVVMVKSAGRPASCSGSTRARRCRTTPTPPPPARRSIGGCEGDDDVARLARRRRVVRVLYIADSPELVLPADTPLIPARYHGLWIDLAVCEAYKDSDNFPAAQALRADIARRMQDVIARYETRNRQHSPFMTVRMASEDD
jgi:hypothetical protein